MDFWTLPKIGREYYRVHIETEPPINTWEISFDGGQIWTDMTHDAQTGYNSVLVAGPFFEPEVGDVAVFSVISESVVPYVRAVDNPEVIIRTTPRIDLI
jgi:hypothetical protein